MCVVEGLSLDSKKRACEPFWSQITYRGIGNRSRRSSCASSCGSANSYERRKRRQRSSRRTHRKREKTYLGEVLVPLLLVVASLAPLRDRLAVEDEYVEESIEEEDRVGSDRDRVEEDGFGRSLEAVRHERGLDHDERVVDVLRVKDVAVGARQKRSAPARKEGGGGTNR